MPLRIPEIPALGLERVQQTIQELLSIPGFVQDNFGGTLPIGLPSITLPHEVHNLGLQDLAEGRGLEAAQATGFRLLIMVNQEVLAAAELALDPGGVLGPVTNFSRGQPVQDLVATIRRAEGLGQVQSGSFEPRLLRVPPLHVLALWLKDDAAGQDQLLPVGGSEPVPVQAFLDGLQDRARALLAMTGEHLVA